MHKLSTNNRIVIKYSLMQFKFPVKNSPKLGLALGGGAARGISHIGVIQVMEELGLPVHVVAGTSMGAIVGAIFLIEGSSRGVVERMDQFFLSEAFKEAGFEALRERGHDESANWLLSVTGLIRRGFRYSLSMTRQSIISREIFEEIINELIPDIMIEDLPGPFAAASLDVASGQEVIWTSGSLREAVWSSSAIPGFFPPLEKDGMVLVDGGWTNAVPVEPAFDLGAHRVIAVDISREVEELLEYKRGVSLALRAAVLTSKHLRDAQLKKADLVLKPEVGYVHWADFREPEILIQKGREAAMVELEGLRKMAKEQATGPALLEILLSWWRERASPALRKRMENKKTRRHLLDTRRTSE